MGIRQGNSRSYQDVKDYAIASQEFPREREVLYIKEARIPVSGVKR